MGGEEGGYEAVTGGRTGDDADRRKRADGVRPTLETEDRNGEGGGEVAGVTGAGAMADKAVETEWERYGVEGFKPGDRAWRTFGVEGGDLKR